MNKDRTSKSLNVNKSRSNLINNDVTGEERAETTDKISGGLTFEAV